MHPPATETDNTSARSEAMRALTDEDIVARVLSGETSLFEIIMRRYNQRLFRALRALVRNDAEAEDILQEAYGRAYRHLGQFAGRSRFSTWLTQIALNEARARQRRGDRLTSLKDHDQLAAEDSMWPVSTRTPEDDASSSELQGVLVRAIDRLPASLRLVFVLREVEGLGTDETAECLGVSAGGVKVRLHRARSRLRSMVDQQLGVDVRRLHGFAGERCDRIVATLMDRIKHDGEGKVGE